MKKRVLTVAVLLLAAGAQGFAQLNVQDAAAKAAEALAQTAEEKAPEAKPQTILAAAKKTPEVHKTGKAFASCREEMASLPPAERAAYYREHAAEIDG